MSRSSSPFPHCQPVMRESIHLRGLRLSWNGGMSARWPAGEAGGVVRDQMSRSTAKPTSDSGPARRAGHVADWIVNPRNPLTSRVLVNQFGTPLWPGRLNTPNDFVSTATGLRTRNCSTRLAADFMEHGWSVKRLHRMIVLSAAYRQSAQYREDAAMKDGANRLLWRMSPRRLAAEELRDAVCKSAANSSWTSAGRVSRPSSIAMATFQTMFCSMPRAANVPANRLHVQYPHV